MSAAPRSQFAALLSELRAAQAERSELFSDAEKQRLRLALHGAARGAGYTGKKEVTEVTNLSPAAEAAVGKASDVYQTELSARLDAADAKEKTLNKRLWTLAPEVPLIADEGSDPIVIKEYWHSSYASTGGGDRYARGQAELARLACEGKGVRVEIRSAERNWQLVAWVAEDLDVEVLRRLSLPFREIIRRTWDMGLNPRVYWPCLPHGFEESEGLDFLGNDLRAPENAGLVTHEQDKRTMERAASAAFDVYDPIVWDAETKSWKVPMRSGHHVYGRVLPAHVVLVRRVESNLFTRRTVITVGSPLLVTHPEKVELNWSDTPERRFDSLFGGVQ